MGITIFIVIGSAIIAIVLGFMLIGNQDKSQQIARRLAGSVPVQESVEASASAQLMRDEGLSTLPWLNRFLASWSRIDYVRNLLMQAGMDTKPGQILLMSGVAFLGTFEIGHLFFGGNIAPFLTAIILGSLPICVVYFKRYQRLSAFESNFPEAIDLLARAVKAGHGLNTGMEIVGQEMSEPIAGEFRTTYEEQRLGLHFREALINLTKRVPLQDVRFFAAALIIQDETGGNLAEILGNLSATVRDRFKIRGEIRVRTAQGKLTAAILVSLPIAMLFLMNFVNPEYSSSLYKDPLGLLALAVAATMQIIGAFILWAIVNIEV
ncbi:MAG TPA: type II secretion system F family protein [Candidatus Saccharimonadales bacterium]|jgi:tight adherence protein B|nr:type II secretion system F family protein [Candidatus Saccharimonadales bacterium]